MLSSDRDSGRRTLLTVPEVAAELGCGRTLVYSLIGARQLTVVKIGRLTRIPVAAVDDFVSRHAMDSIASFPPVVPQVHRSGTSGKSAPEGLAVAQGQPFEAGAGRGARRLPTLRGARDPTAHSLGA